MTYPNFLARKKIKKILFYIWWIQKKYLPLYCQFKTTKQWEQLKM